MNQNNLLLINSSGRNNGSITRKLADKTVNQLRMGKNYSVISRDLSTGLPYIDEQWITATFTPIDQRTEQQHQVLVFSDMLVDEILQSQTIVIAAPIYNFSIPAVLKAWIDLIARSQLTFKYTEQGPVGLIQNKKVYIVMASGGVLLGSPVDYASTYLKQVLGFVGMTDVTIIDASTVNIESDELVIAA